jgi:2,3-bisphosphoglycerate-independent phosphoglycerate mutase
MWRHFVVAMPPFFGYTFLKLMQRFRGNGMDPISFLKDLVIPAETKIILLVMDGLGGLPQQKGGKTELEMAQTPHLDRLAKESSCGLLDPILMGITPGSGPAHLALFGYNPLKYRVGRGVLAALGIGFELQPSDVAARINFATADSDGLVIDRRAGRISNEENTRLIHLLEDIHIAGVKIFLRTVEEYRAVLVLRGSNLSGELADMDPQQLGVPPKDIAALNPESEPTAEIVRQFLGQAKERLAAEHPANMILMRGFDRYEPLPSFQELYGIASAAIVTYPMYKGVARLAGMDAIGSPRSLAEEFEVLEKHYDNYDYFFVHVKQTDSSGEDGDFARKVSVIEEVDRHLPELISLKPDVLAITGDHSSPAVLRSHSWHAVPLLLRSQYSRPDAALAFSESECARGCLGRFPAMNLMGLILANALRLTKYGA